MFRARSLAFAWLALSLAVRIAHAQGGPDTLMVPGEEQVLAGENLARNGGCAVWDARRLRMLVVGGGWQSSGTSDTSWAQYGTVYRTPAENAWHRLDTTPAEPAREDACAVYDSTTDAVWMFGGFHNTPVSSSRWTTQVFGDIWKLDMATATWTRYPPAALGWPQPRTRARMVLDELRGWLWMMGGRDSLGAPLVDLWSMDLASPGTWTRHPSQGITPAPRSDFVFVLDPELDRLFVHGGMGAGGALQDTWELSLASPHAWIDHGTSALAPAGHVAGVLDRTHGEVVAFARGESANVHALDLTTSTWRTHALTTSLALETNAVVLDPTLDRIVIGWNGVMCCSPNTRPVLGWVALHRRAGPLGFQASPTGIAIDRGSVNIDWNVGFTHALWAPVVLELSARGVTQARDAVFLPASGSTTLGFLGFGPGERVTTRLRTFNGLQDEYSDDVVIDLPPPPLALDITPLDAPSSGTPPFRTFHPRFDVPSDSARMLMPLIVQFRVNEGPWRDLRSEFPGPDSILTFAFDELPLGGSWHQLAWRLVWAGPDNVVRASPALSVPGPGAPPPSPLALSAPYPSPADGGFTVRFAPIGASGARLQIYDLQGRQFLSQPLPASTTTAVVRTNGLPQGLYVVRLVSGGRSQSRRVLVVQ